MFYFISNRRCWDIWSYPYCCFTVCFILFLTVSDWKTYSQLCFSLQVIFDFSLLFQVFVPWFFKLVCSTFSCVCLCFLLHDTEQKLKYPCSILLKFVGLPHVKQNLHFVLTCIFYNSFHLKFYVISNDLLYFYYF